MNQAHEYPEFQRHGEALADAYAIYCERWRER